jgi:uncharacterized damage-inducible protein DinB
MDYQQIFEYNRLVRRSFLDILAELPWSEVVTDREASFYSLRNIFLHTLDVEEFLIHHLLQGTLENRIKRAFDEFNDIDSMKARTIETDNKTEIFLEALSTERLNAVVEFPFDGRPSLMLTVEDILIQNLTEQLHHRGELIGLLWQMDIEPPNMEWLWYVDEANNGRAEKRPPR